MMICAMIYYYDPKQLTIVGFDWSLLSALDENSRWFKLNRCIPWGNYPQGIIRGLVASRFPSQRGPLSDCSGHYQTYT